jgi:hypothetical protein
MDKVKDFLEKHVQWIALAVGGLVLMWSLSTYVFTGGVRVTVGNEELGPGEVDPFVRARSAERLRAALAGPGGDVPDPPVIGEEFASAFAFADAPQVAVPTVAVAVPGRLPTFVAMEMPEGLDSVDALPTLPPPELLAVESGRTTVLVPTAAGLDAEEDVLPVLTRFVIPQAQLDETFRGMGLSPEYLNTTVLDVRLVRERRLADGTYAERLEIPLLRNQPDRPAMPASDASLSEKNEYLVWAQDNPDLVVQPPFYEIIGGDDPRYMADPDADPATENEQRERAIIDGFHEGFRADDPDTWPPAADRTPEERRAIRDYLRQRRDGGPTGPGGPGGPGNPYGPGGPGGGPPPGTTPYGDAGDGYDDGTVLASFQDRGRRGGRDGRDGPGGPGGPGGEMMTPYGPIPGGPGMPFNPYMPDGPDFFGPDAGFPGAGRSVAAVPSEFNPAQLTQDIEGWAFDETAISGETYRYNVVYSLRNPVFATSNLTDDPELVERLAIEVDTESAAWQAGWSDPVEVKPLTRWFMKSVLPDRQSVQFEVFRWQDGGWQSRTFRVAAGEPLGDVVSDDGVEVDYRTGRLVVDVRQNMRGTDLIAVLMDDQGRFTTHDDEEDESDDYDTLADEADRNADAIAGR